jgi:hypothetical protein
MTITRSRAISCSVVLGTFLAVGAVAGSGCSSDPDPVDNGPTDTGTEAAADTGGKVDTGAKPDTGPKPETAPPPSCDLDLPSDFACKPPTKTPGSTKCSEATLQSFVKACYKPLGGDATKCTAWKSANADCATCTTAWTYKSGAPARDYCYYQIMTTECANAVFCYFSCINEVCADCASDPTEYTDCQTRNRASKPPGKCYENSYKAAETATCFDSAKLDPCIVDDYALTTPDPVKLSDQLLTFYRGACRDNADWKDATSGGDAGPLDGGTDVGTEVGDAAVDSTILDAEVGD